MMSLSRRSLLAIAAVVDIALHARPTPVSAKSLAGRHNLPPRHLETVLQALVHAGLLKGIRGPKGGYELARERRKITAGDIARTIMNTVQDSDEETEPHSELIKIVVSPLIQQGTERFLEALDAITIEDLCHDAEAHNVFSTDGDVADFMI